MELKEFLNSKGHDLTELNANINKPVREIDENGLFVIPKKCGHGDIDKVLGDPTYLQIATSKEGQSCAEPTHVSWKEVVCGGPTSDLANHDGQAGPSRRVSALHPSRLTQSDAFTGVNESTRLFFKPTLDSEMTMDNVNVTAIAPPMDFLIQGREQWKSSLVAFFAGSSLSFEKTKDRLLKMWGNNGLHRVFYNPKGFYTLKFESVAVKDNVLRLGSVMLDGRMLFLKPWMEGTSFTKNVLTQVPIWVKFLNVPHSYWSMDGLSYIASAIGVPISLDKPTAALEPMKYARICLNYKADDPKPRQIWVPVLSDDDDSIVKVPVEVEYPIMPPNCSTCKCFGHSLAKCKKNPLISTTSDPRTDEQTQKSGKEIATLPKDHSKQSKRSQNTLKISEPVKSSELILFHSHHHQPNESPLQLGNSFASLDEIPVNESTANLSIDRVDRVESSFEISDADLVDATKQMENAKALGTVTANNELVPVSTTNLHQDTNQMSINGMELGTSDMTKTGSSHQQKTKESDHLGVGNNKIVLIPATNLHQDTNQMSTNRMELDEPDVTKTSFPQHKNKDSDQLGKLRGDNKKEDSSLVVGHKMVMNSNKAKEPILVIDLPVHLGESNAPKVNNVSTAKPVETPSSTSTRVTRNTNRKNKGKGSQKGSPGLGGKPATSLSK